MWKTVLAGTTALAIAGGTLAYAQQGPGPRGPHWRPSAEDVSAFTDARVAALHAGLKLTADQEKNWPAVESALRDLGKQALTAERAVSTYKSENNIVSADGKPIGEQQISELNSKLVAARAQHRLPREAEPAGDISVLVVSGDERHGEVRFTREPLQEAGRQPVTRDHRAGQDHDDSFNRSHAGRRRAARSQ